MDKNASFTIGKVTGVHGLGGNLKVWSYAQSVDAYGPGKTVLLKSKKDEESAYTITRAWMHKKGVLLKLEGVDDRNAAENLVGRIILIDREQLPEPQEDTWYWEDLIGLDVMDNENNFVGTIEQIFPTTAHDILVVKRKGKETLIPMHEQFVKSVDLDTQVMRVVLPEGL